MKENYLTLRKELEIYSKNLSKKKEIIVFNKSDMIDDKTLSNLRQKIKNEFKKNFYIISTFNNKNLLDIKKIISKNVL